MGITWLSFLSSLSCTLHSGWDGRSTVWALIEILHSMHWFMSLGDTEAVLMKGIMQKYIEIDLARSVGRGWADGRQCLRVPAGLDTKAFVLLVSEGWGCRPDLIRSLPPPAGQEIILSLVTMLNDAFCTNLCTRPLLYRKGNDWQVAATTKAKELAIVVVGGSNANRIAERMERHKRQVFRLITPGWRITGGGMESMVRNIASLDLQPDCLIIQALDNSAYYCLQEDGTLSLPARSGVDGKFHVKGELRVASEEQTMALLRLLVPLIKAVPGATVLLVTCLPSYTNAPCCEDNTHMVGRDPGTAARIVADLAQMKKHVRAFANRENLSQLKIVDPVQLLDGINMAGHVDPVHFPDQLYDKLATCLVDRLASSSRRSSSYSCAEQDPKWIRLISSGSA